MGAKAVEVTENDVEFLEQSNAIEGIYDGGSLDRAVGAWRYALGLKRLAPKTVCRIHGILMEGSMADPSWEGAFRPVGVRVGGYLAPPPGEVPGLMGEWCRETWVMPHDFETVRRLHVRFERIHPFADGNGRLGRILMNWQKARQLGRPAMVIREDEREEYYQWFRDII
jgi:Fic family protein